jgi:integrase
MVDPQTMLNVDRTLQEHERCGWLRDPKTRARFRVLASTGVRPSELKRAQPTDVSLERRVWTVRDGKGGFRPGLYLTDDMLGAWQLFIQVVAWGQFNTGSFAIRLRKAGWPANIRPYQMRHSVGITLSERGVDLSDVQQVLGHTRIETTRKHYVPVLNSRMQRAGETLAGRLPWVECPVELPRESPVVSSGVERFQREKSGVGQPVGQRRKGKKSA